MKEAGRIADELGRALHGDPWHGSPLLDILGDVTAREAAAHPIPGAHSIWEIVLHLTGWAREVARRTREGRPGEPAGGDWPVVPRAEPAAWDTARSDLEAAHRDLAATAAALDEDMLDLAVGGSRDPAQGTGTSHYVMLHGCSQHMAYHAGQVALLRKALRTESPA